MTGMERMNKYIKNNPWYPSYQNARKRCLYPYGDYFHRGIKLLMTLNNFKKLWFRDKAYLMERPSIDRMNGNGHYILKNCRFIELSENCRVGSLGHNRTSKPIRCIETGKAYSSIKQAAKEIKGSVFHLISALKGRCEMAYGYRWEYIK